MVASFTLCFSGDTCICLGDVNKYMNSEWAMKSFRERFTTSNDDEATVITAYPWCHLFVGLTSPAGKCVAGHYCLLASTEQNPIGQSYGDYCTAGHYCPEGTGSPVPCPIGTYLPSTGQSLLIHCIDCALGKYCDTVGQANYTGETIRPSLCYW